MRKIFVVISFCLMLLSITGCNFMGGDDMLIEVDSITLTDLEGEEYVIDSSWDYLDVISIATLRLNTDTLMIEVDSKIKRHDGVEEITTGTFYRKDHRINYYDFEVKHQDTEKAIIKEYLERIFNEEKEIGQNNYAKYQYNSEQAFGGLEYITYGEGKKNEYFYNEDFPTQPPVQSKLSEMHVSYSHVKQMLTQIRLYAIYPERWYMNDNNEREVLDFDAHFTRSFKLYKNYIIFEEETPFSTEPFGNDRWLYNYYMNSLNSGYSLKKTIKYNYKTNTIDYIKYEGTAIYSFIDRDNPATLEAMVTFKKFDEKKFNQSFNELKTFIYDNTIIRSSN